MRQEFSFLSKDGRTKVYAVRRVPEGKPIGVVQLVHGMVEYIGRYTETRSLAFSGRRTRTASWSMTWRPCTG